MLLKSDRRRWALAGIAAVAVIGTCVAPYAQADEGGRPAQTQKKAAALEEVWRTDFDGDAGSLPSGDDWIIDKGHSYPGGPDNWGTGEIQEYTDSTENLQLDGEGHLKITALKNGDNWTSARIETKRTDFAAPGGGKMRIEAGLELQELDRLRQQHMEQHRPQLGLKQRQSRRHKLFRRRQRALHRRGPRRADRFG